MKRVVTTYFLWYAFYMDSIEGIRDVCCKFICIYLVATTKFIGCLTAMVLLLKF